jgi:hypothetical protein
MTRMKILPIAIIAVALILILSIPIPPHQGRFIVDLLDAGHAPLFGVASLLLLQLGPRERKGTLREYLFVLLMALALGILTELAQRAEGGDAELKDVIGDLFGAAAFLLFHWTLCHRGSAGSRWVLRLVSLALLAAIFTPPVISGMADFHRNRVFPVILDFDSAWDASRCRPDDAILEVTPAPPASGKPAGNRMGRVTFEPVRLSAFVINEPYPDWSGYNHFAFTVYSELPGPVQLNLTILGRYSRDRNSGHFQERLTINPGINAIRIPLPSINRRLDLTAIFRIILAVSRPEKPFVVYLDDFRLE